MKVRDKMDLEKAIKKCTAIVTTKFNNDYSIDSVDKEAIEIVLQSLKDKQKAVKNYEQMYDEDEGEISNLRWKNEIYIESIKSYKEALQNSMPTKKIEAKIEELNEEFKNYEVDVNCSQDNYYELSDKYAFAEEKLRELLEDK